MARFSERTKFDQLKYNKNIEAIRAKRRKRILIVVLILAAITAAYLLLSFYFRSHFYPRTVINEINCSWKNVSNSGETLRHGADGYVLTLYEREDQTDEITGEEIALEITPEAQLQELLDQQSGFDWIIHFFSPTEANFESTIVYDEGLLKDAMDRLNCLDEKNIIYPEAPKLSDYIEGEGYEIIDPVIGTVINKDILLANLQQAAGTMTTSLDLEETGCYDDPDYTKDFEELEKMQSKLNAVVNITITYEFGENQEVLNGTQLSQWLVIEDEPPEVEDEEDDDDEDAEEEESTEDDGSVQDEEGPYVSVDREKLQEYVDDLAEKYTTKWKEHTLVNHSGETVTVAGGNYGWNVDADSTLEALIGYLDAGEDYTGEVEFFQRAAQFDYPDYGSTYLEVDIAEQHFWYYRDGELTLDSDLVSGNPNRGRSTPKGTYQIAYKARNQVLSGEGYTTPVSYWMPFVSGCGFHDASWRGSFGGSIYLYDGSHGCLNLPYSVAEELYGYIEGGEAVLIY